MLQTKPEHMALENTKRMARLRDAKTRTMGLDIDSLDAMVKENETKKRAVKEAEMAEARRMQELQAVLLEAEASIFEQQSAQNQEMAQSWRAQAAQREEMKRREKKGRPAAIVPEETGKSGCQNFDGEDSAFEQRRRLQAQQFRQWAQAQIVEKQGKKDAEKDEDYKTAQYLKEVENACTLMEGEHLDNQARARQEMVMYNRMLAEEKRRKEQESRNADQKANFEEIQKALDDPYLNTELAAQSSSMPGRARKDNFKGMGPEAVREMSEENRRLTEEKAAARKKEKEDDLADAANMRNISDQLNMQQYELEERKQQEVQKQKAFLESQKQELSIKNAQGREAAKGVVGKEFFGAFGSSNR